MAIVNKPTKLKEEEIKKIQSINTRYATQTYQLTNIMLNLDVLQKQKDSIIKQINDIKGEEKTITDDIVKNYGQGYVNVDDWTFIPKNNDTSK